MIVKRRKRITVEAADDGELEERLAVLLDAMTAHGAEILRIERLATPVRATPQAQVFYEMVVLREAPRV
ncbi:MAG: hypothetical protein JNK45_20180 [Myxococcales bacterium]|jgi:hypothetical protein|nr:hypothetical protein [Myxococcales bacterium]